MMETFPKKASCMLLGVSPCTWQLGEGGCIYLTPGKNPCGLEAGQQARIWKEEDTKSPTDKNH